MTYTANQTWKRSKPVKDGGCWRILRHDGVMVGAFETKALAQRRIDTARYLR